MCTYVRMYSHSIAKVIELNFYNAFEPLNIGNFQRSTSMCMWLCMHNLPFETVSLYLNQTLLSYSSGLLKLRVTNTNPSPS